MSQLYVSGNCPSANYPVVLKEIKKRKRHAVIQWSADDWGHILQSASMYKLRLPNHSYSEAWAKLISIYWSFSAPAALAICTQRQGYDLICLSLCVFILLSLLCSLCAPSTSLPLFHHRFGPSLIRYPTFGLRSFNKVAIWAGMASCSWWFQEDRRTLKMLWLANIVWAFSWVKLLRESR